MGGEGQCEKHGSSFRAPAETDTTIATIAVKLLREQGLEGKLAFYR